MAEQQTRPETAEPTVGYVFNPYEPEEVVFVPGAPKPVKFRNGRVDFDLTDPVQKMLFNQLSKRPNIVSATSLQDTQLMITLSRMNQETCMRKAGASDPQKVFNEAQFILAVQLSRETPVPYTRHDVATALEMMGRVLPAAKEHIFAQAQAESEMAQAARQYEQFEAIEQNAPSEDEEELLPDPSTDGAVDDDRGLPDRWPVPSSAAVGDPGVEQSGAPAHPAAAGEPAAPLQNPFAKSE